MINQEKKVAFGSIAGFLAFGFGSGLAPKAPGTVGTLAALPFLWLWQPLPWFAQLTVLLLTFMMGVHLCQYTSQRLGVHDHSGIVWDEFVGLWLTFFMVPLSWQNIIIGFTLFRFFDIIKPFPIKWLDKHLFGGLGIMVDDIAAGFLACLLLHLSKVFLQ